MERFLPNPEKLIRKDNQESQPTHGRRLHMQLRLFHFLQENILSEENKAGGLHAVWPVLLSTQCSGGGCHKSFRLFPCIQRWNTIKTSRIHFVTAETSQQGRQQSLWCWILFPEKEKNCQVFFFTRSCLHDFVFCRLDKFQFKAAHNFRLKKAKGTLLAELHLHFPCFCLEWFYFSTDKWYFCLLSDRFQKQAQNKIHLSLSHQITRC